MVVCVCRGVRCSTVRSVIRSGAGTVDAVGEACEAGTDCGACRSVIEDLIEEHQEEAAARVHLPMVTAA
ncbi:MAG: (2Fe-2S)-binding protein [Polyangiales bacterium]